MTTFSGERRVTSRREDGTEIVRATITRPADCFYLCELAERAQTWVDEVLVPRARQAFYDDPDPSKRFRFRRFEYDLSITLSPFDEEVAELCIEATLSRARGERLASEHSVYYMRLSDGALLPPHEMALTKKGTAAGAS